MKETSKFQFISSFKVVTAFEMSKIEKLAVQEGADETAFMEEAGKNIAETLLHHFQEKKISKPLILLFVGKGNNGGDAFVAGRYLLKAGCSVKALFLFPKNECSKLCQKNWGLFLSEGGSVEKFQENASFEKEAFILDGLLGTGFQGPLSGVLEKAILKMNALKRYVFSIDIPSGLNGTTGEAKTAVFANETISLGLLKSGFFLRKGWNLVGKLHRKDFGLKDTYIEKADSFGFIPSPKNLKELLPLVERTRHKYQAGYVIGFAGSKQFKGAPKMTGLAALRSGAGIVRVFHREEIGETPHELICQKWTESAWKKEKERAKAVFLGPGLGTGKETLSWLKKELKKLTIPSVFDADALQANLSYPKHSLLTPHRGEMLRLLSLEKAPNEEEFLAKCHKFSQKNEIVLLLKGAPTFVFSPFHSPVIVPYGDPGMATAGSGDVLTGILAALLAQNLNPFDAAVLGASLHGISGEIAAQKKTSYGEIAGDVLESIPESFQRVLGWGEEDASR